MALSIVPAELKLPTEAEFWAFALQVPVASRDTGLGPITPWGTQKYFIQRLFEGLANGKRQFLVAKAGQVGQSLIMQLVTAYWILKFPGLQGVAAADAEDNRDYFRDNITQMIAQAPGAIPMRLNNKNVVVWENESRLLFQVAGPRTGKRLGVGRGFAFNWNTEVPLWQNPNAFTYLRTRFSDAHPARLSVSEGTARGKNWWFDIWEEARDAKDIERIFLAWWMREDYALDRDSELFKHYWTGQLTPRERAWTKELQRLYKRQLTPEQWAWRRYYVKEKAGGDDKTADQEMPTVIEDSFEASGVSFLSLEAIRRVRKGVDEAPAPKHIRYDFGRHIEDSQPRPTIASRSQLRVWEEPLPAVGYVVSAVPAHSSRAECPTFVCSVWKASRENLDQVAEFSEEDPDQLGMQQFSWVCAHLQGSYRVHRRAFILETAGMGKGVLQELKSLRDSGWGTMKRGDLAQMMGGPHNYLWRRPDSLSGGAALHWQNTPDLEIFLLNRLRDQVASGAVLIRSEHTLNELERVRQEGDTFNPQGKDPAIHHVISAALAVESWRTQLRPLFERMQGPSRADSVPGRMVEQFFHDLRSKKPETAGRR